MKIPYGMSNFADVRDEGYLYVDKTRFLPVLEDIGGRYLVLLRPRRMGKSLFSSMLAHYYDRRLSNRWDELFRGLWIHDHPTSERGRYLVLSLDFSQVGTDGGLPAMRRTFVSVVRNASLDLLRGYVGECPSFGDVLNDLKKTEDAEVVLSTLMSAVRHEGQKLYVLIDEYDHFTNRLLAAGEQDLYESIATKTGFVRSFYSTLKAGTASGAVGRMLVTGVTPLLLDDLSSGFNISTNVSQDADLQCVAGFTHGEIDRIVTDFLASRPAFAARAELSDREKLKDVLERHYDGYRFSRRAPERVFNSDMVLYFLDEAARNDGYPVDMLDPNARTDYSRLQHLSSNVGAGAELRREILETIVSTGGVESSLVRQFGVRSFSSRDSFVSLLYYMGLLTLPDGPQTELVRFEIPNRVIRELQWEFLAGVLADEGPLTFDATDFKMAISKMAVQGDIEPFLTLFHDRVVKVLGNKDLRRFDERAIKLMLLAFISFSRVLHPLSEKEFAQGYCDLFLGASPLYSVARYAWLLELKYLKSGATAAEIERAFADAGEQVARYANDDRLVPLLTLGRSLKAGALVFVGAKKVLFRSWPPEPGQRKAAPSKRAQAASGRKARR